MPTNPQQVDFEQIRLRELHEILKRRREANVPIQKDADGNFKLPSEDLVGLALSGGGVRSASFNLGLLQALYQKGVLRHIDYLSTVSGGGYVGGSLSSLSLHPETEFEWKTGASQHGKPSAGEEEETRGKFPLAPRKDGRQPARVLDLIHGGHYLRRPLIFLNRYLIGVLLTNVVALASVIMLASACAWGFRYLDHTWMINWLYALGFQGDIGRAFFPTSLCFLLWMLMWGISYWRRGAQAEGRVARWFMTLTFVSFLLACASLVGTGDVSLVHLRDNYGIEPPEETIRSISGDIKTYFFVALAIALIPYLRVKDLIRSGTRPRSAVEGWIFGIASRALLYGIPLLIFGWLARENISHFNENRRTERHGVTFNTQYEFIPLEFRTWSPTWQKIELQATDAAETTTSNAFAVSRRIWSEVDHDEVRRSIEALDNISEFDRNTSLLGRWIAYLGYAVTRYSNDVTEQYLNRERYLDLRWSICTQLNRSLLVDPQYYLSFEQISETIAVESPELPPEIARQRSQVIEALIAEAKLLERRINDAQHAELSFAQWVEQRNALLRQLETIDDPLDDQRREMRRSLLELMGADFTSFVELEAELQQINWNLTKQYFGQELSPKSTVYAMVVLDADQRTRWSWLMWSLGLFLLSGCIVNMNATSLHGFYRNTLAKMWITETPGVGRRIPLAQLETVARGAPYHLINATAHLIGRRKHTDRSSTDIFLFSQAYCGSNRMGYLPTENYMLGRMDLSNAMALSGGAVSPTQVQNPLLAVLLMLSNSRLGQWLPNPGHGLYFTGFFDRLLSWLPPVPIRLLVGAFQSAERRNYCFVSDGGHHENLGIESLLLRRCRLIIASDATADQGYEFRDIVRLLRRMRFEHGIRILALEQGAGGVPLEDLTPPRTSDDPSAQSQTAAARITKDNFADSHYFVARILYPQDSPQDTPREGYLVFIKPNFTGDEATDLMRYQLEDPAFPHDPTTDQFYDPQKFESYRQLGFHIGRIVCCEQFGNCAPDHKHPEPLVHWTPAGPDSCGDFSSDADEDEQAEHRISGKLERGRSKKDHPK